MQKVNEMKKTCQEVSIKYDLLPYMDTHHRGIFLLLWEKSWNNTWRARAVDWYLCNCRRWQWPWIRAPVTQDEPWTTSSWSSCKKNYLNRSDVPPRAFVFYTVWMKNEPPVKVGVWPHNPRISTHAWNLCGERRYWRYYARDVSQLTS